jgi:HNH endonuclease
VSFIISQLQKLAYLRRAGYRCEYCRRQIYDDFYEIDHVFPRSQGGEDTSENFAIACKRCNLNKGSNICWRDPITGKVSNLFHPREMKWDSHFLFIGREIRGKTASGRATCALLLRTTPQYRPRDLEWQPLEVFQNNIEVYQYLNDLRFFRHTNQFSLLDELLLTRQFPLPGLDKNQIFQANFIKSFILMEVYLTRSTESDLVKGLCMGTSLLKTYKGDNDKYLSILHIQSKLLQQSATLSYISGNPERAFSFQKQSFQKYQKELEIRKLNSKIEEVNKFAELEVSSMRNKYEEIEISPEVILDYQKISYDADEYNKIVFQKHLIDIILSHSKIVNYLGIKIYHRSSEILETSGYCDGSNFALQISLRRRWWILNLMYSDYTDYDLLTSDLKFWKKAGMFNELREFMCYLVRNRAKISEKIVREIFYEVLKTNSLYEKKYLQNVEQYIIQI